MRKNVIYIQENNNLNRFIIAQEKTYDIALKEIKEGKKSSHWIWYIFPQIKGLGQSFNANYYAITDLGEAKAYLENPLLRKRLLEISKALLDVQNKTAIEILGYIDALKVHSSMTLFSYAEKEEKIFHEVLSKYYDNKIDQRTIEILTKQKIYKK